MAGEMLNDSNSAPPLFSDDPLDPDELRRFGHEAWVSRAVAAVNEAARSSKSTVLAIVGPWGSGKTSLLKAVQERIQSEASAGWILIQFDPWNYQDPESLRLGFFREVHNTLKGSPRFKAARDGVGDILDFGAPFVSFGSSWAGMPAAGGIIKQLSKAVRSEKTAVKLKAEIVAHLKAQNVRLLVVMDDVDRLEPAELTEVFRLARALGNIEGFYYLLSYDEQSLLDVISNSFLVPEVGEPGEVRSRARTYTEKIVQVRLAVPPMRLAQVDYFHELWVPRRMSSMNIEFTAVDTARYGALYQDHLRPLMTTPRLIRAYATQVEFCLPPMLGEVDLVDFMATRWIQVRFPDTYAALPAALQYVIDHEAWPRVAGRRGGDIDEDLKEILAEALARRGVDQSEISLVVPLLMSLRGEFDLVSPQEPSGPRMGIWQSTYMEKFFSTTPPPEQLSQKTMRTTVERISLSGPSDEDATQLIKWLSRERWVAMEAIERSTAPHIERSGRDRILTWLGDSYDVLGDLHGSDFVNSPALAIVDLCARFCIASEGAPAYAALYSLAETSPSLANQVLGRLIGKFSTLDSDLEKSSNFPNSGLMHLSELLWPHMLTALENPLEFLSESAWRFFWSYNAWAPDRIRAFIQGPGCQWSMEDVLARLVDVDSYNLQRFSHGLDDSWLAEVQALFPQEVEQLFEGASLQLPPPPVADNWESRKALGLAIASAKLRASSE